MNIADPMSKNYWNIKNMFKEGAGMDREKGGAERWYQIGRLSSDCEVPCLLCYGVWIILRPVGSLGRVLSRE